ncbi:hypothetical protein ACLM5J_17110 [Nocardioides sp. Bht2]|uniref:hypothetical protein n=1 Tax=Nocardioides sp. Bht2 TaxID=3392297 RepID=UPI0039B5BCFD
MPDTADPQPAPPPARRSAMLVAIVLVAALVGAGIWIKQRPEAAEPGTLIPAANAARPATAARFSTPGGAVSVLVTPPRRQVEAADYGSQQPRIARGDRFIGIDVRASEAVRPLLEASLIADGRSYPLDALKDEEYWVVVEGTGGKLAVELSYDGDRQRVDLATGKRERGLAVGLDQRYQVTSCSVTARDPSGVSRPVHQNCPELILNVSTWDTTRGWVSDPGERWVSVAPAPYGVVQRIGSWRSLDITSGGALTVNGEVAQPGERGEVARVTGDPKIVEVRYRASPYDGGVWRVVVRAEIEKVAR